MTSVPPEEETENPIDVAETEKFEFGKGYDLSYFKDIREKYQGKRKARRRTAEGLVEITSYPTRPALWLDFKKSKGTCSSRHTSIHSIQSKTALENGMDHFTLSASQNVQEWSTDVSGYGNLAGEFMKTPECHAAVVAWTALVKKYQLKREKDSEWIAHHKEAEDQRKRKRVETIYGKTSGYLAATRTEAAASDANKQSNGGRKQLCNMQLLSRGQLDEDDPPNQQPPLPATPSQIHDDHLHQLSQRSGVQDIIHSVSLEQDIIEASILQLNKKKKEANQESE
uniref:Uncharacterized protein n=1 Tax=Daphnia galeata TaxID=27404 RepID=A0A8J2RM94_9CRUS|nr:unnamed protein product [Daphnia galeata]